MKHFKTLLILGVIIFVFFAMPSFADASPDPGGDPNAGGGTPVGAFPINAGLLPMFIYGLIYASLKIRQLSVKEN